MLKAKKPPPRCSRCSRQASRPTHLRVRNVIIDRDELLCETCSDGFFFWYVEGP